MHNDIEELFGRLKPRGVDPDLRPRVLDAMTKQLRRESPSRWLRLAALATAASIVVGIAMNVWASKRSERRLAQLFGPPPISKQAMELAKAIEEITDAETGQWVYRQLTVPRAPRDASAEYAKYVAAVNRLIKELQTVSRDSYHETPEKDTEMERDRPGRAGGDRTGGQRLVRLDHRYTA